MFFLLYKRTDDGVFDDFPKISDHFPKICEEARRTFPNIFRKFPKIPEDIQRVPKISEDYQGRPEDVSMTQQSWHQWNQRKLHMWGYRIVFINLLPLGIPLTFI